MRRLDCSTVESNANQTQVSASGSSAPGPRAAVTTRSGGETLPRKSLSPGAAREPTQNAIHAKSEPATAEPSRGPDHSARILACSHSLETACKQSRVIKPQYDRTWIRCPYPILPVLCPHPQPLAKKRPLLPNRILRHSTARVGSGQARSAEALQSPIIQHERHKKGAIRFEGGRSSGLRLPPTDFCWGSRLSREVFPWPVHRGSGLTGALARWAIGEKSIKFCNTRMRSSSARQIHQTLGLQTSGLHAAIGG